MDGHAICFSQCNERVWTLTLPHGETEEDALSSRVAFQTFINIPEKNEYINK
jgi:hypothetical protein